MLPGGSYSVIAHYPGDGKFASSDSSPAISVKVGQESSLTSLSLVTPDPITGLPIYTATSAVYGSVYVLRMDVTNSSGNRCADLNTEAISYACPTGNLTVTPAPADMNPPPGTIPGHYTLNTQGYAEDEPIQLSPAVYSFVASYAGDNSYGASVSNPLHVTISAAPTSTTMSGVPSSTVAAASTQINGLVTTSSNGVAPTGTLQVLNNGVPLGGPVIVQGTASNSTSPAGAQATIVATLPVGNDSISVKYSGDVNYATSTSTATAVTVSDFSVSANPSPINISAPGQGGSSTITVTPISDFTGTVNLTVTGGCPTGATCTFSPASVAPNGVSAATSTLTITTSAPALAPFAMPEGTPPGFRFPAGLIRLAMALLILSLLLVAVSSRRWRPAFMIAASTFLIASLWMACGGGGGTTGPPAPSPAVSLSSGSLTFSAQNIGTTSSSQSVTLSNTGNAVLSITSISRTGTNASEFGESNNCGSSVAAGANCAINVTFSPAGTGTRTAAVSIVDNASGSPHSFSLTGTGVGQPTPPGTYPVAVNAASGADSHSITVNVVVQ